MSTISVENQVFELIADSSVQPHDWVVQVSPDHQPFFSSLKGNNKLFELTEDDYNGKMEGYVLDCQLHTYNQGKPQLQVQVRRTGW